MSVKRNLYRKQEVKQFHQEARKWNSDMEFWKVELLFFKRLLEFYGLRALDKKDQLTVASLQEKLDYFIHEEIPDYKRELIDHEEYLQDLAENKLKIEDTTYEDKHNQQKRLIASFKKEFIQLKAELYSYTENLKQ